MRCIRFLTAVLTACCMLCILPPLRVLAETPAASAHTYASILTEADSGTVLKATNPDTPLPIGTLTKLMTALLTAQAVTVGDLALNTMLSAPPAAQEQKGAVIWLLSGEKMSVEDLLKGLLIGNANDAAVTLAAELAGTESAFTEKMNAAAFSLGMRNTRFADATGLSPDNISTVRDMAILCRAVLQCPFLPPILSTWRTFLRGEQTELVNENTLTRTYEGCLGLKAGHGEPCGYTLCAAAQQGKMRCITVILGCDDEFERFTYAKNLLAIGFSDYHVVTPDFDTEFLRPITVQGGLTGAVSIYADELLCAAVPNGKSLSCVLILPQYVQAPVNAGQRLGEAAFYCEDALIYEVSLRAAVSVPKRTFRDCFAMLLANLFN